MNEQQKKAVPQPQQISSSSAATTSTTEKEGASRSQRSGLPLVVRLRAMLERTPRLEPQWERRVVLCEVLADGADDYTIDRIVGP
jgi:hypothetical protein